MLLSTLTAISPIDGRYRLQLEALAPWFSEYGLMKYRLEVEVRYFLRLADNGIFELPETFNRDAFEALYLSFTEADAQQIKELERTTNHDVKAVEYFLKQKLWEMDAGEVAEWVHFGLTSQDINNTAIPMLWQDALDKCFVPALDNLCEALIKMCDDYSFEPMLARTHGQAASPTTVGKELRVFWERLRTLAMDFENLPLLGKFGGATGNFNAHVVAFPDVNWERFATDFLFEDLKLERSDYTTQIGHYDDLAAQFDALKRINTILIDFCRDMWAYISMDYFKQQLKEGETGSSAMPHKVNPIDFENAEGNLGIANALYEHLSAKLPISRLQRDLTDSTVLRNIGVPLAHSYLALLSIQKGISKLTLNKAKLEADLEQHWEVIAEGIQTILRRENYPKPYEALKELTRGKDGITKASIHAFIEGLEVSETVKAELKNITPHNYIGATAEAWQQKWER